MKHKPMLGTVIVTICLLVTGRYGLTQSQSQEQPPRCQLRAQQPRENVDIAGASSSQSLLAAEIEAICQLNNQQPRTDDGAIATADNPSPEHFTIPSLWWQEHQIGDALNSHRLIDSWRAYDNAISPHTGESVSHVDVVINSQLWPLLNYLERYALITQFGESAKSYSYQLRLFTGNRLVGLQVCDFMDESFTPICIVELNYFGQGAIRGGRQR